MRTARCRPRSRCAPAGAGTARRPRTLRSTGLAARYRLRVPPQGSRYSERPCDHEQLHLGRALTDLEDLRIAVVAGDGVFVHEPVAAEDLSRIAGVVHGGIARGELGDRRLLLERPAGVAEPCGVVPRE